MLHSKSNSVFHSSILQIGLKDDFLLIIGILVNLNSNNYEQFLITFSLLFEQNLQIENIHFWFIIYNINFCNLFEKVTRKFERIWKFVFEQYILKIWLCFKTPFYLQKEDQS